MRTGPHVIAQLDGLVYEQLDDLDGVTLYHQRPWHRLLERVFGMHVQALVDFDADGRLQLYLPFVEKRRPGRDVKVRVSLPLSHSIGPAIRPGYRFCFPSWLAPFEAHAELPGLETHAPHVVTELDLTHFRSADDLLAAFDLKSVRQRLKRAERAGFTVTVGNQLELFRAFTRLQAATRRRQGALTYPRCFFPIMGEEVGESARVHLTLYDGQPVAGVIFIHHGETALYSYGADAGDPAMRNDGANQLALWSAIREAFEAGCTTVDFGSSPAHQEGLWRYKERWGGVTRPLVHSWLGVDARPQDAVLTRLRGPILKRLPLPVFEAVNSPLFRAVVKACLIGSTKLGRSLRR